MNLIFVKRGFVRSKSSDVQNFAVFWIYFKIKKGNSAHNWGMRFRVISRYFRYIHLQNATSMHVIAFSNQPNKSVPISE